MRLLVAISVVLSLLHAVQHADGIAVMSVDLGSEWMKIAIVSPGVPMEIVLNKESKRKTPATIAFRDGERSFGEDALVVGVRFPQNSYSYLLDLLGKSVDNPLVQLFQKRFPYYKIEADPDRGTVVFRHDSESVYSVEELLAQMLQSARQMAQASAAQPVKEAVLTVPGFFNQAERRALLQAAEMAGLKVLQLINDYTAVALNYGIFRRKDFNETAQYIMFYDMGASSTTATVVSYQIVKTKDRGFVETNPQLAVLGVGYDRTLGGLEMQLRLRDYLAKKFNEQGKTKSDVFGSPRALAKLFKEAGRLKNVLSANAEHYAQVEGLLDDVDFKLLVTRDDFEELCADLFDRIQKPVEQALKASGLDMNVISQVILVGAGTRVPKVQERLAAAVGLELGKSINTDEAAALGAVYKAADLSTGFKVKKFLTKDAVLFPIQVVFERELENGAGTKQIRRTLFGPMNPYPQKKVLTFNKHMNDFSFYVGYGDLDSLPEHEIQALGSLNLSRVDLTGVSEALSKHKDSHGVESKGIKAHFSMDESGVLQLSGVELALEKTVSPEEQEAEAADAEGTLSKIGSTISKLFTSSDEKKDEQKQEKDEKAEEKQSEDSSGKEGQEGGDAARQEGEGKEQKSDDEKSAGEKSETEEKNAKEGAEKADAKNVTKPAEKKPKIILLKEPINAAEEKSGVPALNSEQFQSSIKKLESLNEFDEQRKRRESALNALESFVFDAQNKLYADEYRAAATEEELEKIKQTCSEVSDWLYEDGSDADAQAYEDKLSELKQLTRPLFRRVWEHQERPAALSSLGEIIEMSSKFLDGAKNGSEIFTPVELETLEKVIKETKEWKQKMEEDQAQLKLSDTPKLTVKSITDKISLLDREVKYLINKAKIWKPKKKEDTKEKAEDTSSSGSKDKNETTTDKKTESDQPLPDSTSDDGEDRSPDMDPEAVPLPEDMTGGAEEGGPVVPEPDLPASADPLSSDKKADVVKEKDGESHTEL
ncbi:hypoxia up-regulated protein 1 isoform X1 [Schistocerca piceifrons]|uniref:hypoxia up-regulated protein 1 isoform X1 n=1 Tax=Schistocerca piceifrons TaxID=274613 RepID=UPI001F5EF5F7|nr:hypoxia up-regulated protein 1 isoform X1 [Schistocerca piceifrons]XP_047099617.1 hypoxia up-regulated protein 1 isoform X1 [Schistocerca piceifrons]